SRRDVGIPGDKSKTGNPHGFGVPQGGLRCAEQCIGVGLFCSGIRRLNRGVPWTGRGVRSTCVGAGT
ncbi:MAG: hypothetical protein ACJ73J_06360, partial [Actinomycetes bacterium]